MDWAFKRIFGSVASVPVLIGFLNDLLHHGLPGITSLRIIDPYLPSAIETLKKTAVDVRAVLEDGTEILIEMQILPVAGFTQRMTLNGCKAISSQNPNVRNAAQIALQSNLSKQEYQAMSRRQLYYWDQINMITHATETGKLEVAGALLDEGLSVSLILKTTGLSPAALTALQAERNLRLTSQKTRSPRKKTVTK
jgi:hypothetical protein